jgi:hypothetical protein
MINLSAEQKQELDDLLDKANNQRLALDQTLSAIEAFVGEVDGLDEMVGNGIDADDLLASIEEESEQEDVDEEDD